MLIPTPHRVLVARDYVDFRKSIDGLAALCEAHLQEHPLDGSLYVFTNRRHNALKMLIWSNGGFIMLYKKLEKGQFFWPIFESDRLVMSATEIAALMDGFELPKKRKTKLWNPKKVLEKADKLDI